MEEMKRRRNTSDTIRLDAEGNWYHGEYPILHERTIQFLHKNIAIDKDGRFYLTGEDKPVFFEAEDVPYFITKIERTIVGYLITLTDDSIELLDFHNMWVGKDDVLYCLVKGGLCSAKFFRAPYYEITKDLVKEGTEYFIQYGKKRYPIQTTPPKTLLEVQREREAEIKKAEKISQKAAKAAAPAPKKPVAKKPAAKPAPKKVAAKKSAPKKPATKKKPAPKKSKPKAGKSKPKKASKPSHAPKKAAKKKSPKAKK